MLPKLDLIDVESSNTKLVANFKSVVRCPMSFTKTPAPVPFTQSKEVAPEPE